MGGGRRGGASHPLRVESADPSIIPGKLAHNEWFCFLPDRKLKLQQKVGCFFFLALNFCSYSSKTAKIKLAHLVGGFMPLNVGEGLFNFDYCQSK